jgi:isobutyryl-CoA dehydrogenase
MNSQFLNEDQVMIQEMAYDFAAAELAPFASEWDKSKHFPKD